MAAVSSLQNNQQTHNLSSNPVDDIPIPVSKPKTFEQLLEEQLGKGETGGIVSMPKSPSK